MKSRKILRIIVMVFLISLTFYEAKNYAGYYYFYNFKRFLEKFEGTYEERVRRGEELIKKAFNLRKDSEFYKTAGEFYYEIAVKENELGNVEKREKDIDRSIECFKKAIKLAIVDPFAYFGTGKAYLLSNFPYATYRERTKIYFKRAVELTPNDEFILLHTIRLYLSDWIFNSEEEKSFTLTMIKKILTLNKSHANQIFKWWKEFSLDKKILEKEIVNNDPFLQDCLKKYLFKSISREKS